jgi:hypothetical protein
VCKVSRTELICRFQRGGAGRSIMQASPPWRWCPHPVAGGAAAIRCAGSPLARFGRTSGQGRPRMRMALAGSTASKPTSGRADEHAPGILMCDLRLGRSVRLVAQTRANLRPRGELQLRPCPIEIIPAWGCQPGKREHGWIRGGAAVGMAVLGIDPPVAAHPPDGPEHHPLYRARRHGELGYVLEFPATLFS